MTFDQLIADLKKKIYHPVYILQGEEPYYIDRIADYMEANILSDSEKEFNQTVLYGKDIDVPTLVSYARRYPMMSNYQLVILREAQDLKSLFGNEKSEKDDRNPLLEYLLKPTKSTILVICYKYKKIDKRTKAGKEMVKSSVFFESTKLYDNQLPDWITQYVLGTGYRIHPKAAVLTAEYLGNNLSNIANEIGKIILNLKPGDEITAGMIQENIGISKDFNIFELTNAIGKRNIYKINQIANYFANNPKSNPFTLSITQMYGYFMKLLIYHKLESKDKNSVASALGVNPYFVSEYESAAGAYPVQHCLRNISYLREYDLRSKGVNNENANDGQLLKELVYKIVH